MAIDKEELFSKLTLLGEKEVREKLAQSVYGTRKIGLVQEWLRQQEETHEIIRQQKAEEIAKDQAASQRSSTRAGWWVAAVTTVALLISVYFNIRDRQPEVVHQILPPTIVTIGETFPVGKSATGLFLQERGPINAVVVTAPGFREDLDFEFRGQKYRLHIGEDDYIVQMMDMNPLKKLMLMKVYEVD